MIKMVMDEERLREVLTFSRIGLPEEEFGEVLERVNSVLRMCDEMQELDHDKVEPFEWNVKQMPARRPDTPVVWAGRDAFLDQAPVRDGDFFRVPRIIARDGETSEDEFEEE
ncbi:MAG: Asp-tRNA(Asn)/Glu-tRNA(Gln) amidotransferase subunit GatC [Synergistaceae bacterium]|nr:Asp-tRNA(Asn)/Glu-tRNA(Gln) amidotransferase subunit GatC [Synergistaceae bacterium]